MDKDILISLFTDLLYIRLTEERIVKEYPQKEIRCPIHFSIGQEAISVGICNNLTKNDLLFSNHRSHAHYLAKGGNLQKFLAEIYGKLEGCSKGRGGSMHLTDLDSNFIASTPIVGGTVSLAVGASLALSKKKSNSIVVVFLGDGAMEEGTIHECFNFAKLKNLPILFVCENNLYSVYTPLNKRQPKRKLSDIAKAHGLTSYETDGNDVLSIYNISNEVIQKIRSGNGPAFIEMFTYRWLEHCGPFCDDLLEYRGENELNTWKKLDPLKLFKEKIIFDKILNINNIETLTEKITKKIDMAITLAKKLPYPGPNELKKYIYAKNE